MRDGSEVSPLNIPAWRGFPLRRRLEERYGLATFVELDTKALALAEGWRGVAQGKRNYMAMVVSTGIGGGLVLDGRLVEGRTGNAGHVGHVIVEPTAGRARAGAGAAWNRRRPAGRSPPLPGGPPQRQAPR